MANRTALESARMTVRGDRAELRVEGETVTIEKQAPQATTVTFPVAAIRAAQLRAPTRTTRGWLHVSVVGGSLAPPGELAASGDPYTLPLGVRNAVSARRFATLVARHVRERGMPRDEGQRAGQGSSGVSIRSGAPPAFAAPEAALPPPPPAGPGAGSSSGRGPAEAVDVVYELEALAHLHARGVLTDDEFERAKARVLG